MDKAAYAEYLKVSLGIEDFLRPQSYVSPSSFTVYYNSQARLGFFSSTPLLPEDMQLFEKMIGAMGLKLEEVGLFVAPVAEGPSTCLVRVGLEENMMAPTLGSWIEGEGYKAFTSHSLKSLREHPELKKSSWEHLKKIRTAI